MTDIADRLAIQDLLVRYATALDNRDWVLLGSVFTPEAQVQYPGSPHLDGFVAARDFCDRALSRFRVTQHLLGNYDIRVNGDTAAATCSLQAIHVHPDEAGGGIYTLWGTYTDRLARTSEGWRITERTLTSSHTAASPGPG